jgi:hypothetical protein
MALLSRRCNHDKKTIDFITYNNSNSCIDCDDVVGVQMSGPIEIINPRTMTCTLMEDGVIIAEYKMEQCDKCSRLVKFDSFGYQKGYDRTENIIWFCGDCR